MLIDLQTICDRYGIRDTGVLHIGAHLAEERGAYRRCGFRRVLWIEANPELARNLEQAVAATPAGFDREAVITAAVFDTEGQELTFNITNNAQASSLLELGTHRTSYPDIRVEKTIRVHTRRVDALRAAQPGLFEGLAFVNLDIQGVELQALRGFGDLLPQVRWIYTEVNRDHVYKGNALIWELDRFLLDAGFVRRETRMKSANWGDALYVRAPLSAAARRRRIASGRVAEFIWRMLAPALRMLKQAGRRLRGSRTGR